MIPASRFGRILNLQIKELNKLPDRWNGGLRAGRRHGHSLSLSLSTDSLSGCRLLVFKISLKSVSRIMSIKLFIRQKTGRQTHMRREAYSQSTLLEKHYEKNNYQPKLFFDVVHWATVNPAMLAATANFSFVLWRPNSFGTRNRLGRDVGILGERHLSRDITRDAFLSDVATLPAGK